MKLTLVRHEEVQEEYKNKYNGHNDISLSKRGKEQAKKLCKKLNNLEFDAVFCSDLRRAKETASELKHKIIYTNHLREKSWGRHEGLSFDDIIKQDKIEYKNFLQWINALDGEDYQLYRLRLKEFFLNYLPSLKKQNILIITHAGVIRVLQTLLHDKTLEEVFSKKITYGELIYENI
jgi:broad specificity phosphatase PhoE